MNFTNNYGKTNKQATITLQTWEVGNYMETLSTPVDYVFTASECNKFLEVKHIVLGKLEKRDIELIENFEMIFQGFNSSAITAQESFNLNRPELSTELTINGYIGFGID